MPSTTWSAHSRASLWTAPSRAPMHTCAFMVAQAVPPRRCPLAERRLVDVVVINGLSHCLDPRRGWDRAYQPPPKACSRDGMAAIMTAPRGGSRVGSAQGGKRMSARVERVGIALLLAAACSTDSTQLADQNVGAPDAGTDLLCPLGAGGMGPPAIPHTASSNDQSAFDEFSWQSLLALGGAQANGSNPPLWTQWSSTGSFLNLVAQWSRNGSVASEFPAFGAEYYPTTCLDYCAQQGIDCSAHQTIEQVAKINDSIFEADSMGLSSDPVIATNGTFLRYEIRFNQ